MRLLLCSVCTQMHIMCIPHYVRVVSGRCPKTWIQTPKAVLEGDISHPTHRPRLEESMSSLATPGLVYLRSQQATLMPALCAPVFSTHTQWPKALLVPQLGRAGTESHPSLARATCLQKGVGFCKCPSTQHREESRKQPSGCIGQNPTE